MVAFALCLQFALVDHLSTCISALEVRTVLVDKEIQEQTKINLSLCA